MKSFLERTFVSRTPIILLFVFGAALALSQDSCSTAPKRSATIIQVDMSKEHDSGQFSPEKGDKVYVAGNFNNWNKYQVMLTDKKGNWIYSANIEKYLKQTEDGLPIDTLQFNFLIKPGNNRRMTNQGWEDIGARKMALSTIESGSPILLFGKPFDNKEPFDVTFTVGMNGEETLGFFKPGRGDQIVVSGSFCNWSSEGIPLESKGGGIYSRKIRIRQNPKNPLEYSFRIIAKDNAVIPNHGWETEPMRKANLARRSITLPFAEFDNIRRVARFVIGTAKWQHQGKFKPLKGDILQIKLLLDGKTHLSDALFQVNKNRFETALEIPLTVTNVKWQVVENMKRDLTQMKSVDVGLDGTVIRNSD